KKHCQKDKAENMEDENHVFHISIFFSRINEPEKQCEKGGKEKEEKRYFGNNIIHKSTWVFLNFINGSVFRINPSIERCVSMVKAIQCNFWIFYFSLFVKTIVERKPFSITFHKRHRIQFFI